MPKKSRTTLAGLAVLLVTLASGVASAREPTPPPPTNPPTPSKPPPAQISDEARQHFNAGVALLEDLEGEKVEEAYREFRAAYDLSGSPKILGNMGFCAMRLERDGEAVDAYSRYLRDVDDIDPKERSQIVKDLQTLQVGVVRLSIEVNKPGVRVLDERIPVRGARVTNAYGPVEKKIEIGVRAGHHVITAKLAGYEDAVWEVEAYAGSKDTYSFTMKAPPPPPPPPGSGGGSSGPGVGPWIAIGTGGALLVAGTITGVIALGKSSDIKNKCPNDVCPRSFNLDDERSSAKTFVRVTDVLLITGGVVTLGGVGWLLFAGGDSKAEKKAGLATTVARGTSFGCGPAECRASWKVAF